MKRAAGLLCCAGLVYLLVLGRLVAPLGALFFTLFAFALMALPGIGLGLGLFGWDVRQHPESVFFGAVIGIALSGFISLLIGFLIHWSALLIVVGLALATCVCFLFAWSRRDNPVVDFLRPWMDADYAVVGGVSLAVLASVTV